MIFLYCWMEKLVDLNILVRIVYPYAYSQPARGMLWMRLLRFFARKENALLQLPIWSFLCCAWVSARFLMFDFGRKFFFLCRLVLFSMSVGSFFYVGRFCISRSCLYTFNIALMPCLLRECSLTGNCC
jgi:hypothetical protein